MAKRTYRQIRYFREGYPGNSEGATRANLIGGALFDGNTKIVSLQITALIGFGFFVNDTPSPIRILHNGDPVADYSTHCTFTFPEQIIQLAPIYNVKCEASSIDRVDAWNSQYGDSQPEWLIIDYVEEVDN